MTRWDKAAFIALVIAVAFLAIREYEDRAMIRELQDYIQISYLYSHAKQA
jgi:hypothetical protein